MISRPYPQVFAHLGLARVSLELFAVNALLLTDAYPAADADEHAWYADIEAYESAGPGYVHGGLALPNTAFGYDDDLGRAVLSSDPLVIDDAGAPFRYVAVYQPAGTPADSPLIAYADTVQDNDPAGDTITLIFAGGVLRLGPTA